MLRVCIIEKFTILFFCKQIPCPIINCRLVFEFSPTGAVLPMSDFRTVKLLKYVSWADYFTMACEFVFYGFVVYYCIEEAIEIRKHSFAYFTYIWNIMDLAVLAVSIHQNHCKTILKYSIKFSLGPHPIIYLCFLQMCIIYILFDYFLQQFVSSELNTLLSQPDQFADFTQLGYLTTQYNNVTAIAVFLAWIKLFKYLSFNKTMKQLTRTLAKVSYSKQFLRTNSFHKKNYRPN